MTAFASAARNTAVAALVAATVFAFPAQAQSRLSLAERVAALEEKASGQGAAQGNIELLNQIQALQSQIATLQGQNEELQHQIDELKRTSKTQYVDLDSRIGRLEGGGMPMSAGDNAAATTPPADQGLPDVQLGGQPPAASPSPAVVQPSAPVASGDMAAPAVPSVSADPVAEKAAYDAAFSALKDGRYAESARRFQVFVDQYPQSDLAGNAYYWLGESYYAAQNFRVAQDTFETLLTRYPASQKVSDALLKVGYCQYETQQWDQAEATLNDVVTRYPNTQAARLAQGRLRALKLEAKR